MPPLTAKGYKPTPKLQPLAEKTNKNASYQFLDVLGEGSFGRVILGKSKQTGEEVAIKANFIDPRVDGYGRVAELQLMSDSCHHPFLIWFKEICLESPLDQKISLPVDDRTNAVRKVKLDSLYFVMSRADCSLDELLLDHNYPKIIPSIKSIMLQILFGLEYLHAKGICHRDFKPDNVLVYIGDEDVLMVKIGDFGLGKALDPHLGNTTTIVQKLYRPPEVAVCCKHYSPSVDSWSCGILFYRLLTGGKYLYDVKKDDDEVILGKIHQIVPLDGISYPSGNQKLLTEVTKTPSIHSLPSLLRKNIRPEVLKECFDGQEEELYTLIEKMLDPHLERMTPTQALNSSLFDSDREYIAEFRQKTKISEDGKWLGKPLKIIVDVEKNEDGTFNKSKFRHFGFNGAIEIFNRRNETNKAGRYTFPFYNPQVWFASLSLYDRWLVWRRSPDIREKKGETTREEVENAYYVALYLIVKILISRSVYRFKDIHPNFEGTWDSVAYLECEMIVDVSNLRPYQPTIYEELTSFKEEMMFKLVRLVTKFLHNYNGVTWRDLAGKFLLSMEEEPTS